VIHIIYVVSKTRAGVPSLSVVARATIHVSVDDQHLLTHGKLIGLIKALPRELDSNCQKILGYLGSQKDAKGVIIPLDLLDDKDVAAHVVDKTGWRAVVVTVKTEVVPAKPAKKVNLLFFFFARNAKQLL
jgi:hypothetical protein